jgi:UDP-glucose 4-epimerase
MEANQKYRSLVTGGAGFIGSHVARHCLELGHEVVVLDDLSGGFEDQVPEGAEFVEGSIIDYDLVSRLFEEHKFDYVYHLAAYAAEGLSHFIRRFNYSNNLIGSVNLINQSVLHKVKCFVFTSSIAVYGSGQLPMLEEMTPMPEDPYGVSKLAVELDLKCAHEMFGLNYVITRPHNVYGENQNVGDRYRNVIGIFINQIMQGKPLTIFGDGEQTRAFSYIDDVAPHLANSVHLDAAYNQIINIGADTPFSVNQLAQVVSDSLGVELDVTHLEARNEVMHAYASHEKAKDLFSFQSTISLEEGVGRMVDWVKTAGVRRSQDFENIEIMDKLPPSWMSEVKSKQELK